VIDPLWKSPFPIRVTGVDLLLQPRRATIRFSSGETEAKVSLLVPRDIGPIMDVIEHCAELRIIDTNTEDRGQRCFSRYRLEVWDEDNPIGTVLVDGFEV